MISALLSVPVLVVALMLQVGVFSRMLLLQGTADLLLLSIAAWSLHERVRTAWLWALAAGLLVTAISALPSITPLIGYLGVVVISRVLLRRLWQIPIMAMLMTTFVGTLFFHTISIFVLQLTGSPIGWVEAFSLVTLPSSLLNLLLALPVYTVFNDLANWVYPVEIEA